MLAIQSKIRFVQCNIAIQKRMGIGDLGSQQLSRDEIL